MRPSTIRASLLLALAGVLLLTPARAASPKPYDQPTKVVRQPLPRDPENPQAKPRLSCFYYPHFVVKEVDLGEKGAEQLSILGVAGAATPPCRRQNAADEKVLSDWSGYFKGVKGDYIFFDADDGWNDGVGFAVMNAAGQKLFEDVSKGKLAIESAASGLTLRYLRVYGAPCSLRGNAAGCWQKIKDDTGLAGNAPDCRKSYEREIERTPEYKDQVIADPTVIDYAAIVEIAPTGGPTTRAAGPARSCRPAE